MKNNTWIVLKLVSVCVVLELLAEIALNVRAKADTPPWMPGWTLLALGILLYVAVAVVYGESLRYGEVTISNAMWQCLALLIVTIVGVFLFKDRPSVGQWVGLGIVTAGFVIVLSGSKELGNSSWFRPPAFANANSKT
jgi:drug/metabolite transporter (DMT)-like permease